MVKRSVKKSSFDKNSSFVTVTFGEITSTLVKSHSSQVRCCYGNCHIELESFPTSSFSWNAVETHLWGKSQSVCSIDKEYFIKLTQIPYPDAGSDFNYIVHISFCGHETCSDL